MKNNVNTVLVGKKNSLRTFMCGTREKKNNRQIFNKNIPSMNSILSNYKLPSITIEMDM